MSLAPPGAKPARAAFTLLELLSVLAMVAILAGIALGVVRRVSDTGKSARTRAELAALGVALEAFRQHHGDYPRTDDGSQLLRALLGQRGPVADLVVPGRALVETARFTIEDGRLIDPWGHPYAYSYRVTVPWSNPGYVLYSAGPDGREFPRLLAGGFPDATGDGNADNIHANQ